MDKLLLLNLGFGKVNITQVDLDLLELSELIWFWRSLFDWLTFRINEFCIFIQDRVPGLAILNHVGVFHDHFRIEF